MCESTIKVMLVVFFDCKDTVHQEFVLRGQMVNKEMHQEILVCLRDAVGRKKLNCGKTKFGCCIMTMLQLMCCSLSAAVKQNITF
ncbi:hypothetical protein X975_04526, partial [Stegodyphus mimosarum]